MAQRQCYEPAPSVDNMEMESELLADTPRQGLRSLPKRGLLATMGFATVGAWLLWATRTQGGATTFVDADGMGATTELQSVDPCAKYPYISLDKVTHSNLGKKGPDSGAEGIVYEVTEMDPGHSPKHLLMTVNASAAYKAGHAKYNGIHGKYGLVTLAAGNEAEFTIKFMDPTTLKAVKIPKQEFTFFDLDQSSNGDNREYVETMGAKQVWLTKNTEIQVTDLPGGYKKFMSSQPGSGADNPKDPLALTVQQKNRAVTVEFQDFSELKVIFGNTAGQYARYYMFVARPSLICARTTDAASGMDHGMDGQLVALEHTTPPPGAATPPPAFTPAPKCWFTVPVVNYCVPEAWCFWKRR